MPLKAHGTGDDETFSPQDQPAQDEVNTLTPTHLPSQDLPKLS